MGRIPVDLVDRCRRGEGRTGGRGLDGEVGTERMSVWYRLKRVFAPFAASLLPDPSYHLKEDRLRADHDPHPPRRHDP